MWYSFLSDSHWFRRSWKNFFPLYLVPSTRAIEPVCPKKWTGLMFWKLSLTDTVLLNYLEKEDYPIFWEEGFGNGNGGRMVLYQGPRMVEIFILLLSNALEPRKLIKEAPSQCLPWKKWSCLLLKPLGAIVSISIVNTSVALETSWLNFLTL